MLSTRIILAGLWTALMLTYLLGDVLRIFAGDFETGEMDGVKASSWMYLGAAVVMLVPILMLVLTLIIQAPLIRWVNMVVSVLLVIFNLFGLPYKGAYDNFLIGVGFLFNILIIWYAWNWTM